MKPAWLRFALLGDPERSFVEFGDQVWVYVTWPAYGAFAVANAGVRPGLVIDQLEGILTSAEESRNRRDTLRVPEASGGPPGKSPTSSYKQSTNGDLVRDPAGPRQRPGTALGPDRPSRRGRQARRVHQGGDGEVASGVGRSGDAAGAEGPFRLGGCGSSRPGRRILGGQRRRSGGGVDGRSDAEGGSDGDARTRRTQG